MRCVCLDEWKEEIEMYIMEYLLFIMNKNRILLFVVERWDLKDTRGRKVRNICYFLVMEIKREKKYFESKIFFIREGLGR